MMDWEKRARDAELALASLVEMHETQEAATKARGFHDRKRLWGAYQAMREGAWAQAKDVVRRALVAEGVL